MVKLLYLNDGFEIVIVKFYRWVGKFYMDFCVLRINC